MLRLFIPDPPRMDAPFVIPAAQFAHIKARRCAVGDAIALFDGSGCEWRGTLTELTKRDATARLTGQTQGLGFAAPELTLALAVIAADRMDWAIQKTCELGVARIVPLMAQRSQAPGNAAQKMAHWRNVAIAAAEQCGRSKVAQIADPRTVAALLSAESALQVWVAQQGSDGRANTGMQESAVVCIGPEGGWTPQEWTLFESSNALGISLSHATLRSETAAIVAVAALLK
jgi:16S rRNA (uracil1498-N3)-methyltransferase